MHFKVFFVELNLDNFKTLIVVSNGKWLRILTGCKYRLLI